MHSHVKNIDLPMNTNIITLPIIFKGQIMLKMKQMTQNYVVNLPLINISLWFLMLYFMEITLSS